MLAKIKPLFDKLSNYPRLRILLIIIAVIFVFGLVLHLLSSRGNGGAPGAPPSQVQPVSVNPNAPKTPVTPSATTQYNQLADVNQKRQFQAQVAAGDSIFQNPFGNDGSASPSSISDVSAQANATPPSVSGSPNSGNSTAASPGSGANPASGVSPQQFAQQQQAKQQQPDNTAANNPQLQQQINQLQQQLQQQTAQNNQVSQIQNSMNSAVGNLTSSWSIPVATTVQGIPEAPPSAPAAAGQGPVMIKAGTILFAVMNTGLNSDNPGTPVMATIVTGKYRGAKLLGAFTSQNSGTTFQSSALVVQFNQMTLPTMDHNFSINAYALDENTANNAIASSVNNHYLVRYGMLFAASFLQGFGSAYQNYNYSCPPGTSTCVALNNTGVPNTQATATTAAYQGLGQVGTNLAGAAMNVFNNTPPTIKVDAGMGIGVLFMSDIALPAN